LPPTMNRTKHATKIRFALKPHGLVSVVLLTTMPV
jgi:hypothetical protein